MIDSSVITAIVKDCLFKNEEMVDGVPTGKFIGVEGLVTNFGFHPERLESYRETLQNFINELDPKFLSNQGGGYSFLNLPFDKDGRQWGEQISAEELFVLCKGLGMAEYCGPRPMWVVFPGGMPYVVFDSKGIK